MKNIDIITKIASKEIKTNYNNNTMFLISLSFIILNLSILNLGNIFDNTSSDPKSILLSIIHMQMYIIPLYSLILSYDSVLKEREFGILELFMSYPLNYKDILIGKWLGYCTTFTISFLFGFIPVFFYLITIEVSLLQNIQFVINSIWLNMIFNFIGILISTCSKNRTFIISLNMLIWVISIFLYDIFFTIIVIISNGTIIDNYIDIILFLNPSEIFRTNSIIQLIPIDYAEIFSLNTKTINKFTTTTSMIFWFIILFILTYKNKEK